MTIQAVCEIIRAPCIDFAIGTTQNVNDPYFHGAKMEQASIETRKIQTEILNF
jgi:hypothetical protein